jgi:hypothetical protein
MTLFLESLRKPASMGVRTMHFGTVHQLGVDRYNIRKPDRVRVLLNTHLRITDTPDMTVSVRNISNRGFMAEAEAAMEIGSDAMLFLPGVGWALANVRWVNGNRFGAKFSDSINMRQFWRANPPQRITYIDEMRLSA